jgi:hypothetical protein
MSTTAEILAARRLQGFAAHLAATGLEKKAAQARIKSYVKQASNRDAKYSRIGKDILDGLAAK